MFKNAQCKICERQPLKKFKRYALFYTAQKMKFSIKISSVNVTKSEGNCRRKHLLIFEICTCEICEKFVYKHSETIEYVKN